MEDIRQTEMVCRLTILPDSARCHKHITLFTQEEAE
jgi:hypothetical protein